MNETKARFGIEWQSFMKGQWSLGASFSHWDDETYLYINLIFGSLTIGRFAK